MRSSRLMSFALALPVALMLVRLPGAGILAPIVMLGGLIFLHELGHFLVAKWMGLPVETFSLGFGPRLVGFRWRETDVRLSALPLGGYVKLAGFDPGGDESSDPHGFLTQPAWKRVLFYSGGVLANLATALLLLTIVGADGARIIKAEPKPGPLLIQEVIGGYPAAKAGLKAGDELLAVDQLRFPETKWNAAVDYIQSHPDLPVTVEVKRDGAVKSFEVKPVAEDGKGNIGLQPLPAEMDITRRPMTLGDWGTGAKFAVLASVDMAGQVFHFLGRLVTFKASSAQVAGPIGIVRQSAQAARAGWDVFLFMAAGLSLQLAILNILPIPMLDGGHIAVLLFEKARKRDFTIEFKERLFTAGAVLLFSLMAVVIFLDLVKLRH